MKERKLGSWLHEKKTRNRDSRLFSLPLCLSEEEEKAEEKEAFTERERGKRPKSLSSRSGAQFQRDLRHFQSECRKQRKKSWEKCVPTLLLFPPFPDQPDFKQSFEEKWAKLETISAQSKHCSTGIAFKACNKSKEDFDFPRRRKWKLFLGSSYRQHETLLALVSPDGFSRGFLVSFRTKGSSCRDLAFQQGRHEYIDIRHRQCVKEEKKRPRN